MIGWCVYSASDADGALLYVGMSMRTRDRLNDHKNGTEWWRQVTTIKVEHHASRSAARAAEAAAIAAGKPKFNARREAVRAHDPRAVLDDLAVNWGKQILQRRTQMRLSQQALSDRCGFTQRRISSFECGQSFPHDLQKLALAKALNLPVDVLFPWPDAERAS